MVMRVYLGLHDRIFDKPFPLDRNELARAVRFGGRGGGAEGFRPAMQNRRMDLRDVERVGRMRYAWRIARLHTLEAVRHHEGNL